MSNGVYDFESDDYRSITNSRFDDLPRLSHRDGFVHMQASLLDLIEGEQKEKFAKRGYVLVVNGSWGAGKTTATWAMINEIRESIKAKDPDKEPLVIDRSFLPFGNVSESITLFLKEVAHQLWIKGMVDVRKDMEQFILEATPAINQSAYTATLAMGPISIARPIKLAPKDITHDVMVERFQKLVPKGKTVILVIDDLDRLRPTEIVQMMRLVEKLRTLPRVLIILPIYKQIVTEAFQHDLQIPAPAAPTFLRKLTDFEIRVENNLPDLSQAFCELFTPETKEEFDPLLKEYDLRIDALCWFMLMHNIIVAEAVAIAPDLNSAARLFDGTHSQYLYKLQRLFFEHHRMPGSSDREIRPYPTHYRDDGGREYFVPIGRHYSQIANNPGEESSIRQLAESRNIDNVMKLVTKDASLDHQFHSSGGTDFDSGLEQTSSAPALMEVFMPILRDLSNEPLVTDHYKLRDMRILARKIQGHPYFKNNPNSPIGDLYFAVKDSFDAFRF